MIFATAANYNPAVVYAELKMIPAGEYPKKITFSSGRNRERSEFRQLRNLAVAIPEFRAFLEAQLGKTFDLLGRYPLKAIRGDKDILVISFHRFPGFLNWRAQAVLSGFNYRTHGISQQNVRNVGLSIAPTHLDNMACHVDCRHDRRIPLCPLRLAAFLKNFSHLENVFLLIKVKSADVARIAAADGSSARANLDMVLEEKMALARRDGLAVFEDTRRTWVEIPNTRAGRRHFFFQGDVFNLLDVARASYLKREASLAQTFFPPDKVGFRVLVSSWFLR
ncbi:hypothetical protein CMUS01_16020 [Colletotrichum musicola]|uniref:Uncharacterized protein n=1 Tax=Colletotrichum musicola TaxID=2175873 RepID=A0A8H6ISG7_9PEZI|nr:hypothetical protein CMUS01_16020 [Colletotrichum musicola]